MQSLNTLDTVLDRPLVLPKLLSEEFVLLNTPQTWTADAIASLRQQQDLPFVRADASGVVVEINQRFREVYGWTDETLVGKPLGLILPETFRDAHHAGFARFKLTEASTVLNHPLTLATFCSNGVVIDSEHFIVAEKHRDGSWSFAATLRPLGMHG